MWSITDGHPVPNSDSNVWNGGMYFFVSFCLFNEIMKIILYISLLSLEWHLCFVIQQISH
jgi:hypothetical protein